MKKTKLFEMCSAAIQTDSYLWGKWVDWTVEQDGDGSEISKKFIIESMPECCHYEINQDKEIMEISWGADLEFHENVPLNVFYDDKDDQPDLRMLWHNSFYDHPRNGVALYNGEKVWFNEVYMNDKESHYELLQLTPEMIETLDRQHKRFQKMVGYNCDHDPDVYQPYTSSDPDAFAEYYATREETPDMSKCSVIATVQWFQFKDWSRPVA